MRKMKRFTRTMVAPVGLVESCLYNLCRNEIWVIIIVNFKE